MRAGLVGTQTALRGLVVMLALAGCRRNDAKAPAIVSLTPVLADARRLSSLTPDETEQWCSEETRLPPEGLTEDQVQRVECTVSALSKLGDSTTDEQTETCQLEVETCVLKERGPRPCTLGTQPGACRRATIGQLRACVAEMHTATASLAERDLCVESRSNDEIWWVAAGYLYGPACTVIARLCDAG